jgi:hypothetical protein
MINLASEQRRQIVQAAATLTPAARMAFIADVESTLAQHCLGRPASNNDVQRAINCVLDAVARPRSNNSVFMCDSKEVTTMTKQHDDDQFETLPDGRKVLRDQGRMSFSMMAMDAESILRSTVDDMQGKRKRAYTTADAEKFGLKDASAMHRPGFRFSPDAYAKDETLIAYADRDAADAEAWKGNPPTGQGSHGFVEKTGEGEEGDSCSIDGSRGTLQRNSDGELICVPDGSVSGHDHAMSDREAAHAEHRHYLENAWRSPDAGGVADHRPVRRADQMPTRDTVEQAYADHDEWLQNAWRNR